MVQSSKIQYAGEFNIKKCELITHSGNKFDLTQTLELTKVALEKIFDVK